MSDSTEKKIVNFSVRFSHALFERLENTLNAISRDKRPSKDRFIQDAVVEKLGGSVPVPGSPPAVLNIHSLLPGISVKLSEKDTEWLTRFVEFGLEMLNALPGKEDEPSRDDAAAGLDSIAEAARKKEAGVIEATEEFGGSMQADSQVRGRTGKRGGRPPKQNRGGSGD